MSMNLSIILVTYRVRDVVRDCLRSLYDGGTEGLNAEVILVDNASNDSTVEMVRAEFPRVRLIASDENLGFSRANNRGIAEATGRNILLLNPDTLIPKGVLASCVGFLDAQAEDIAAMSCRVESPDGTLQRDCSRRFVTPWSECCRALLLDRLFSRSDVFNREPIVGWDRRDTRPVEAILGAFMLMRRSALERIGGLDERFFLMYEDMDWCKRTKDAGYKILFWPDAHITHLGGCSWRQEKVATYANSHMSAMQYIEKHHPKSLAIVRRISLWGMTLKIALLRANLLRKPGDSYTVEHLAMARAAMQKLQRPLNPASNR